MYKITAMVKEFGLSRSTLLYFLLSLGITEEEVLQIRRWSADSSAR